MDDLIFFWGKIAGFVSSWSVWKHLDGLGFNVLGGFLAGIILPTLIWLRARVNRLKLRQIFGKDFKPKGNYNIVYCPLRLREDIQAFIEQPENFKTHFIKPDYPFQVYGRPLRPFRFYSHGNVFIEEMDQSEDNYSNEHYSKLCWASSFVATYQFRAAKCLTTLFQKGAKLGVTLSAHTDSIGGDNGASFVSLGGPDNNKMTARTITNSGNELIKLYGTNCFISALPDGENYYIVKHQDQPASKYDYGLILRIRPTNFPRRVWVACIGFGEYGTSGAAWYLCHNWNKLWKATKTMSPKTWFKSTNFAAIIRVENGDVETAELCSKDHIFTSKEQLFSVCRDRNEGTRTVHDIDRYQRLARESKAEMTVHIDDLHSHGGYSGIPPLNMTPIGLDIDLFGGGFHATPTCDQVDIKNHFGPVMTTNIAGGGNVVPVDRENTDAGNKPNKKYDNKGDPKQ